VSRSRIFASFSALLILSGVLAACGSSSSNHENPEKVASEATFKGIKSAKVEATLAVTATGKEGGNINASLSGPFQSEGKEQLPQLDLSAKVNGKLRGETVNFEGGLTLLPEKAYVSYKGSTYEVEPNIFSTVRAAIEKAAHQGGGEGSSGLSTACEEALGGVKLGSFLTNLKNEGSTEVGGTQTTHISGDLNAPAAIEAVEKASKNPACASQLSGTTSGALPSSSELTKAKHQIETAVKSAHVDLYVGSDHIIRKVSAVLEIEPPPNSKESGPKKVNLNLQVTLSGVNQTQTISAPSNAKPISALFQELGINPLEALQALESKEGLSKLKGLSGLGKLGASGGLSKILGGMSTEKSGGSESGGGEEGGGGSKTQSYLKCLEGLASKAEAQKCQALLK
jgi:hypothetical protein